MTEIFKPATTFAVGNMLAWAIVMIVIGFEISFEATWCTDTGGWLVPISCGSLSSSKCCSWGWCSCRNPHGLRRIRVMLVLLGRIVGTRRRRPAFSNGFDLRWRAVSAAVGSCPRRWCSVRNPRSVSQTRILRTIHSMGGSVSLR